jgi:diaminopimelate decarboxylase
MVHDTGGYYFSNHFDYNSLPIVGVYSVSGTDEAMTIKCIRRPGSIEDVLCNMQ